MSLSTQSVVFRLTVVSLWCCLVLGDQDVLIFSTSFESESDVRWSVSERTSLWSVENRSLSADSEIVRYSKKSSRSGKTSLSIGPWTKQPHKAVFISLYRTLKTGSYYDAPIVLELWNSGKQSRDLKINLDVSYRDNRFMIVEGNPVKSENIDGFVRTCVFIPNYGLIRSLMLNFVVDSTMKEPFFVDDVSLSFVSDFRSHSYCLLYDKTYPVQRQMLPNFLKPPTNNDREYQITLATQLTKDRLDIVEQTAVVWRGPISAALILYGPPNPAEISEIVERFYRSEMLSRFVTLHVVWEDPLNGKDSKMYPANALRNVAISQCSTEHVFYIDADLILAKSEADTWNYLSRSISRAKVLVKTEQCDKCAFVVPLFNRAYGSLLRYPKTKRELKQHIDDHPSDIEACSLASHSVVDYERWFAATETYEIEYADDMEPYFIVPYSAPLLNDMYSGYGRDKCAYSRDLSADDFRFFMLPEVFLFNLLDRPKSGNRIMVRAREVPDRLFLNIEFHRNDLENGHIRYPASYSARPVSHYSPVTNVHSECHLADNNRYKEDASREDASREDASKGDASREDKKLDLRGTGNTEKGAAREERSIPGHGNVKDDSVEMESDGGIGCDFDMVNFKFSSISDLSSFDKWLPSGRKDLIVENLMKIYGVSTFIEIPSASITHPMRFMLPLMQPEAAISIDPDQEADDHQVNGVFHSYRFKSSVGDALKRVVLDHPGPKLYYLNSGKSSDKQVVELLNRLLQIASDHDVIVTDFGDVIKPDSFWILFFAAVCDNRSTWRLYKKHTFFIVKSRSLRQPPPDSFPDPPSCLEDFRPRSGLSTDIVLVSKNRPLQTFAFMDSLKRFVTGLNKVYLLVKTEDAIFDTGYELMVDCFSSFVTVELIRESATETLGQQLLNIIEFSSAYTIMIAVDEIIWLRPVNLSIVSSMLHDCQSASTFQLRLGENLGSVAKNNHQNRFRAFSFDNDYLTYYPRRLPYDFGYVLNVDGVVSRRLDLIEDFRGFLRMCSSPGCVEQGWIVNRLHVRSRQWHLMYRLSRMVNNMGMVDGRVADRFDSPAEGSYQLAKVLVEERKRIDVERFAKENGNHKNTHQTQPVQFVDLPDECQRPKI